MAGQPVKRAAFRVYDQNRELVLERIELGHSLLDIADDLDTKRSYLAQWCELPTNVQDYAQARVRAGTALAEQALHIADKVEPEVAAILKAKLRVHTRQWLARHYNRALFGEQPPEPVTSMAFIHAEVIRRRSKAAIAAGRLLAPPVEPVATDRPPWEPAEPENPAGNEPAEPETSKTQRTGARDPGGPSSGRGQEKTTNRAAVVSGRLTQPTDTAQ